MKFVEGRKAKSLRNLIIGVVYQIFNVILSFLCRSFLIVKLGQEILGINSLFANILTLLSLADLGFSNVMIWRLYKPIYDNDKELISALLKYYKKVYSVIALIILLIGLAFIPFLKYIISSDIKISNSDIIIYYLIFLFNTLISYLFVYKQIFLSANQEYYVIKIFNLISLIVRSVLLIFSLIIYPNYKLYLLLECLINLISNFCVNVYVSNKYKFINNSCGTISKEQKSEFYFSIRDTFLYKLGGVLISNTDSIIISTVLSTVLVGYLSNYNLIISALNGFISIITGAVFASVGNLAVEKDAEKSNKIFNIVLLIYHYVGAFFAIAMFCTFNDFIILWLKNEEFLLSLDTVLVLCLNFYLMTAITPIYIFRENYGLFGKVKYLFLCAAFINVVSSVIFAKLLGLTGVILGTILCRLLTTVFFEPPYLYSEVFKKSSKDYFKRQFLMLTVSVSSFLLSYFCCSLLPTGWLYFCIKILICFIYVTVLFYIVFNKKEEMRGIKDLIKTIKIKENS